MKAYVLRCLNAVVCPQAERGRSVVVKATTLQTVNKHAPPCRTCLVKMAVATVLDDPEPVALCAG